MKWKLLRELTGCTNRGIYNSVPTLTRLSCNYRLNTMIGGPKERKKRGGSYDGAQVLPSIRKTNPLDCFRWVTHESRQNLFADTFYVSRNKRETENKKKADGWERNESNWNGTESAPVGRSQQSSQANGSLEILFLNEKKEIKKGGGGTNK